MHECTKFYNIKRLLIFKKTMLNSYLSLIVFFVNYMSLTLKVLDSFT
jgi:hypothetical protein